MDPSKPPSAPSSLTPSAQPLPPPALPPLGPCFPPLLLVDVSSGRERRVRNSYENVQEVSFVAAMLARLVTSGLQQRRGIREGGSSGAGLAGGVGDSGGDSVVRVGVITPYRGQVRRIRQELGERRRLKGGVEDGGVDVEVGGALGLLLCVAGLVQPSVWLWR